MSKVASPLVRFYFVWLPVLPSDAVAAATGLAAKETDVRAVHFWDGADALGLAWAKPLGVVDAPETYWGSAEKRALAWDVVTLFARGTRWGAAPPVPHEFRFTDDFDPARFLRSVEAALETPAKPAP